MREKLGKIGIIREEKIPQDARVPLSPEQVAELQNRGYDIVVQPSPHRIFTDEEYHNKGVKTQENLDDCSILMGVKEVPEESLIPDKTYFFFSHTIKKQVYNRSLLQTCVKKNIRLIDYEVLTRDNGQRIIAFGKFAGMVGAHNALWTWAQRTKSYELPRMYTFKDYEEAKKYYATIEIPPVRIVLTGTGRVAQGAAMVLEDLGIKKVTPLDYVTHPFDYSVFTQINSFFYAKRRDGKVFDSVEDFYRNPEDYESDFSHFLGCTDILINGIFWDNKAPAFFTLDQMADPGFKINVIADVTCDIAPVASIPSTVKPSTITDPVYGFDRFTHAIVEPYKKNVIDVMAIDNLPNELPRDASKAFGEMFIAAVLPELKKENSQIIERATVTKNGALGSHFEYLRGFLEGG